MPLELLILYIDLTFSVDRIPHRPPARQKSISCDHDHVHRYRFLHPPRVDELKDDGLCLSKARDGLSIRRTTCDLPDCREPMMLFEAYDSGIVIEQQV